MEDHVVWSLFSHTSLEFIVFVFVIEQSAFYPVKMHYRSSFSIHRLQANGILHYLRMKWTAHSPGVTEDEPVPNTTVTLRHVQLILSLYAASIVWSCLILGIEIVWFKKQHDQRVTVRRISKPFPVVKMK
jgi:hypothetical protein